MAESVCLYNYQSANAACEPDGLERTQMLASLMINLQDPKSNPLKLKTKQHIPITAIYDSAFWNQSHTEDSLEKIQWGGNISQVK